MIRSEAERGIDQARSIRKPAPLLPVAIGLIAGIVVDRQFAILFSPCPIWVYILIVLMGTGVGCITRRSWMTFVAIFIAAAGLGALRHDIALRRLPADHIAAFTRDEPIIATINGRVLTEPSITRPKADIPRAY
ncbi:MAG: hypothetical protein ACE5EC_01290, partial [Phycisphaerae bacterium]